MQRRYCLFNN